MKNQMRIEKLSEQFTIRQDPSNPSNWGIIWEQNGTEGGFISEESARSAALRQGGTEAGEEAATWEW